MGEADAGNQAQKVGTAIGVLAVLLIVRRLRKRRKEKKLLKARAKARARTRARVIEQRIKEEKARGKAGKKAAKGGKRDKKDRSIPEQLIRFTILALAKKIISQQIELVGKDLAGSKLGKKVVEASGT